MIPMKRVSLYMFAFAIFSNSYAQESINKDVKVVSQYTPAVAEATKISVSPQIDDTTSAKPTFEYKINAKRYESEFVTQPISAATMAKERIFYPEKTLIKFGAGTYSTIFGELYYNIYQSDKYAVGLNFDHLSSFGTLKLSNDTLVDAPHSNTNLGFSARRFIKNKTIGFDIKYNRTGVEYYGLENINPASYYYLNSGSSDSTSGASLAEGSSQYHSNFEAAINLQSFAGQEKDDSYTGGFTFSNYGNKYSVGETSIFLDGSYRHNQESMYLLGLATIDVNMLNTSTSTYPQYNYVSGNRATVTLMPRVGFIFSHMDIQVGLNIYNQTGDLDEKGFKIGPHLLANLNLAEDIITAYGGLSSKLNVNKYKDVAYENYYVAPDLSVKSSFYGLRMFGGLKGNFSSKTSFLVEASYSSFTDEHFFVNKLYRTTDPTNTTMTQLFDYSNRFDVVYDDGKLLNLIGEFVVKPTDNLDFILFGSYNQYNLSYQPQAWHKPQLEFGLKSTIRPLEGLIINANVTSIGKRYAFDPTTLDEKTLKQALDISINGEYHYNQRWMFFGGIYNLIASDYYKWNEYPTHGINVRAGLGIKF